jgi:hypothetical protein
MTNRGALGRQAVGRAARQARLRKRPWAVGARLIAPAGRMNATPTKPQSTCHAERSPAPYGAGRREASRSEILRPRTGDQNDKPDKYRRQLVDRKVGRAAARLPDGQDSRTVKLDVLDFLDFLMLFFVFSNVLFDAIASLQPVSRHTLWAMPAVQDVTQLETDTLH